MSQGHISAPDLLISCKNFDRRTPCVLTDRHRPAQALDDRADALDREIDVRVCGRAAEAKANRRAGIVANGANGLQHV